MTHLIVRNDTDVLSRATPTGPLVWLDLRLTECTEYRYAITFERPDAARKCAAMQGATVHTIGEFDETTRHRAIGGRSVERGGTTGAVRRAPVDARQPVAGNRPVRLVTPRRPAAFEPRRDAGYPAPRVAPHAAPDARRVAAGNPAACTQADWRERGRHARLTAYYGEFQRAAW